ncbi:intradiol ring-cleavage dioxygenase [Pseudonocardia sp. TRM90224]|uniref:intradiol ring-cleavage dioxygenase n=1 Tax=Pseudonocardia sp. TRM90224 TaxID=2812678 RepID=UPI001E538E23|nr:intradiol ring-cleavage dioxygenase [Pseudonocardia sp. TRM90224]
MNPQDEHPDHDGGLRVDLPRLLGRRRMLALLTGAGLAAVAGCASAGTPAQSTAAGSAGEIPQETAGPFPGDGSNGPNVLTESGVVRSDIRSSFGALSGTAAGVPLTIELLLVDAANGGAPLPGAALYLWHCDRDGRYSLYEAEDQNYLRGVQQADATGLVRFTSVFPGAYAGRWPHAHFEVYPDLATATSGSTAITTSQLALPKDVCDQVYATDGYSASVSNLARSSLDSDNVFSDGYTSQLAAVTGSVADGLTARLTVPVAS